MLETEPGDGGVCEVDVLGVTRADCDIGIDGLRFLAETGLAASNCGIDVGGGGRSISSVLLDGVRFNLEKNEFARLTIVRFGSEDIGVVGDFVIPGNGFSGDGFRTLCEVLVLSVFESTLSLD